VATLDNLEDIIQNINDNLVPIYGSGAPTNSAVYEGQIYIDNATSEIYIAISTGGGAGDWDQLALQSAIPATPSLDDVLTVGNTSTTSIVIQDLSVVPTQTNIMSPNNLQLFDSGQDLNTQYRVNDIYIEQLSTGDFLQIAIDNTQNQTITFPDTSGQLALLSDTVLTLQNVTDNGNLTDDPIFADSFSSTPTYLSNFASSLGYIGDGTTAHGALSLKEDSTGAGFTSTITTDITLTADRTISVPDADGTLALTSDIPTPSYKVYTAAVSQTGTTAPTVDYLLENTLSGSPTWGYYAVGRYTITLSLAWVNNKTIVFINPGYIPQGFTVGWERNSSSAITIHVRDSAGNYTDGLLFKASVEVRVYN
jgi:hypothetical protein